MLLIILVRRERHEGSFVLRDKRTVTEERTRTKGEKTTRADAFSLLLPAEGQQNLFLSKKYHFDPSLTLIKYHRTIEQKTLYRSVKEKKNFYRLIRENKASLTTFG